MKKFLHFGSSKENTAAQARLKNHGLIMDEDAAAEAGESITSGRHAFESAIVPTKHDTKARPKTSSAVSRSISAGQRNHSTTASSTDKNDSDTLPKRTKSLYQSQLSDQTDKQDQIDSPTSSKAAVIDTAGSYTPRPRFKNSGTNSPGFALNRNSIREPFAHLGKKFKNRPGLAGLFHLSPNRQDGDIVKVSSQDSVVDTKEDVSLPPQAHDSGFVDIIPKATPVRNKLVTVTGAEPNTTPSQVRSHFQESSEESHRTYHDALEQSPVIPEEPVIRIAPTPVTPARYPKRGGTLAKVVPVYPDRSSSLSAGLLDPPPPVPPKSAKRMSRMNLSQSSELRIAQAPSMYLRGIDQAFAAPKQAMEQSEPAVKESQLAVKETDASDSEESEKKSIGGAAFMAMVKAGLALDEDSD